MDILKGGEDGNAKSVSVFKVQEETVQKGCDQCVQNLILHILNDLHGEIRKSGIHF